MTEAGHEILPGPLQEALVDEVQGDERLLWVARPGPRVGNWTDLLIILFGIEWTVGCLVFTGISVAGAISAVKQGSDAQVWVCLSAFGISFVPVGLYVITMPAQARVLLRNTVYAVTDKRAIVIELGYWKVTVRSFEPAQLTGMSRVERSGGLGDLILFESVSVDSEGSRHVTQIGFLNIPDVRRVEAIIKGLAAPALPAGNPRGLVEE